MPWRPLPGDEPDRVIRVGDGVERVLRHLGAPSRGVLSTVFDHWADVVGERLAAHAEPVAVSDGRLVVRVDDPAWANQLRWLEREVLGRIEELTGSNSLAALDVRVGDPHRPARRRASRRRGT